jgi:hypothetical protein
MATDTRSSPPPPPPENHRVTLPSIRTGSFADGGLDGAAARAETPGERALRIALQTREDIGRPPVEATGDPGSGLWAVVAKMSMNMAKIVAWTEAADQAASKRGSAAATAGWILAKTVITLAVGAAAVWLSGFHR